MEGKSRRVLNNKNRGEAQHPSLQVGNIRLNTDFSDFFLAIYVMDKFVDIQLSEAK